MELILLGTGATPPTPRRSGPANAVVVNDRLYLVDAGRNVPQQITAAGFKVADVDHLFFTHFHSDHYSGLGDLILTRWLMGATTPLEIFGPEPVTDIVQRVLHSFQYDIDVRAAEGKPRAGSEVTVTPLLPGATLDLNGIAIRFDKTARHGNVQEMLSYRFTADGRDIVIVGDGAPTDALVPFATGADLLLIHPCLPELIVEMLGQTPEQAAIIAGHHASTRQIADTATAAGVTTVVMSHIVPPMAPSERFVAEVSAGFAGAVIVGEDLARF